MTVALCCTLVTGLGPGREQRVRECMLAAHVGVLVADGKEEKSLSSQVAAQAVFCSRFVSAPNRRVGSPTADSVAREVQLRHEQD
jgi:hypothetical protein